MPSQAGQSAIAKWRSLEDVRQPTLAGKGSASASDKLDAIDDIVKAKAALRRKSTVHTTVTLDYQFSTLTSASLSNLGSTREIAQVSPTRIKVRLSGQPCVVVGTCTLWIKHGVVMVCGARLVSTSQVYHLYSPTTHALPVIEAVEGLAEFELQSDEVDLIDQGVQSLVKLGFPNVWQPRGAVDASNLSFAVLGHHVQPELSEASRYRLLDTSTWRKHIYALSRTPSDYESLPRFLIHGAPNCGTSTFAQNLLNCLLSRCGPEMGVAFIDLEAVMPAFTPPGTICLQHVKTPVFGPPLTRKAVNCGPVSRCHYVGAEETVNDWYLHCCLDLLAYEAEKRPKGSKKPVIIHAPKWLTAMTMDQSSENADLKQRFWQALHPTEVVYLSASEDDFVENIPQLPINATQHLHQTPFDQYRISRQAEMSMQAYFHLVLNETNNCVFNSTPIMYDQNRTYALSFDDMGPLQGVILTDSVPRQYINDAVTGKIAAVLSVDDETLCNIGVSNRGLQTGLYRFASSLATMPFVAKGVSCLGFGYVQGIDESAQMFFLTTPIKEDMLYRTSDQRRKAQLVLVLPAGDVGWLKKEIDET